MPVPAIPSGLVEGATLGPYRIVRRLGEGGMGEVWLAADTRLGRRVALKSLKGEWLSELNARQTVMGEGRALASLVHPHIATLFDVYDADGHLLLVMEYVEGQTLSVLIANGSISPAYALRIVADIAAAVGYAHDHGIIHCDLKPSNVQITLDGSAKVLDFGLARVAADAVDQGRSPSRRMFAGTPPYLAPERVLRGTISGAGDIYSLGVILYEISCGRRPFDEPDVTGLFLAILFSEPVPPSRLVPGLSTDIDKVVARAMARDPKQRYQSAWEFVRELRSTIELLDTHDRDLRSTLPASAAATTTSALSATPQTGSGSSALVSPLHLVFGAGALFFTLTALGFISSIAYNAPLGRTRAFGAESPLAWPYWGARSLVAPFILATGVWILAMILSGLWRLFLALVGATSRRTPLAAARAGVRRALDGVSSATLGQLSLAAHAIVLVLVVKYFLPTLQAITAFAGFGDLQSPQEILPLSPSHFQVHNLYRQILTITLLTAATGWFALARRRLARGEQDGLGPLVGGVAATLLTAALLTYPFRILWHNQGERTSYDGIRCHMVGSHDNEALLFCPSGPPPWKRVVPLDSPFLKRHSVIENIFTEYVQRP